MRLWSLPAAMEGKDLMGSCAPEALADRVLWAAAE